MKHIHMRMLISGLVISIASGAAIADDASDVADLLKDAAQLEANEPKQTKAGRMVADRIMARNMIDYGLRVNSPESIITGVQILVRNPVTPAGKLTQEQKDAHNGQLKKLEEYLGMAVDMRSEDEALLAYAERVAGEIEESTRGLAGGPKSWVVQIDKGEYFQLDPRLVYNSQEVAIVTAYAGKPEDKIMLGATVRHESQNKKNKAAGPHRIRINWNSGPITSGWDCRIYNLTGPDGLEVVIETN